MFGFSHYCVRKAKPAMNNSFITGLLYFIENAPFLYFVSESQRPNVFFQDIHLV